jgi:alkanesulfonate monooxygenase SsuD/methylene tetrahydromethanopterin reductase-like flavin-dependent oxidoreductase (luciferase family)
MLSEPVAVTLQVTSALESLEIPYVIGGSMASTAHGRIRTTLDVDIVADLKPAHVDALVQALGNAFYVDASAARNAIQRRSSFNLIHLEMMFKVDIFIPQDRAFDRQQLRRGEKQIIGPEPDQTAYVASAEDIVLAKLEWYRLGGEVSERQWRDVLGILEVSGNRLDQDYLRRWGATLNVTDLLERALSEAKF